MDIEELGKKPFETLYVYMRTARLLKTLDTYIDALPRYSEKKSPREYAILQNRLGFCYLALKTMRREKDLGLAAKHFGNAIKVCGEKGFKKGYYAAKIGLGLMLPELSAGERTKNVEESIKALSEGRDYFTKEKNPLAYAIVSNGLGSSYVHLYIIDKRESKYLDMARGYFEEVLSMTSHDKFPVQYGRGQIGLGNVFLYLYGLSGDKLQREKALAAFSDARAIFSETFFPADYVSSLFLTTLVYVEDDDFFKVEKYLDETIDAAGNTKDPRYQGFIGYMYAFEAEQGLLE